MRAGCTWNFLPAHLRQADSMRTLVVWGEVAWALGAEGEAAAVWQRRGHTAAIGGGDGADVWCTQRCTEKTQAISQATGPA